MAEMDTSGGGGHKKGPGVKKAKKLSTRVDLTPMVDLGFLLITFFIFTTTMSQPTAMRLGLPKDTQKPEEQNKLKESAALTIMPSKQDKVYYYEGADPSKLQTSDVKKIREVILDKKRRTDPKDFMVIIKPTQDATYKNTVDMIDEMTIDEVKRYALVDITPAEYGFVQKTEVANGIK
ncbi:MAG: biopolymer transporter ExbD [Bacteroidota bacterium]|nr:biopolymer transporter ExbD [Bacteroidota bacterium]MDP4216198.1 biopolymer transporter ExbD [Bacteroidota bacterium]MDP4244397.1 biopolymer transporter ExbD [Bacteroidota bacterium]MDP4256128.1 biopolymer transporter ExbD [Bacteroidota bacterium]MDP4259413.1 biopolymer transporter ExbD [Bacteroidota bacterium]